MRFITSVGVLTLTHPILLLLACIGIATVAALLGILFGAVLNWWRNRRERAAMRSDLNAEDLM